MANYKEIVTKAIISKGKKMFSSDHVINVNNKPSTILGVWIINHNFNGEKSRDAIYINGSYDVNIWYSYDNDSKTEVVKDTNLYNETIKIKNNDNPDSEVIVRSLKQPTCIKVDIVDDSIRYVVEKELGVELVGDIKVKIQADLEEEPWDDIVEDNNTIDSIDIDFIKEDK